MKNSGLSEEFITKARACKSIEELKELARQAGVELSDDDMDAIFDGVLDDWDDSTPVNCHTLSWCPYYRDCHR